MPVLQHTNQVLFVAWQDPESRRYYPVARLMSAVGRDDQAYEFAYIHGAQEAAQAGFKPFLAFPQLDRVCRSDDLFAFFANRVMSHERTDFAATVSRLGLDPQNADDMTILARSGGVRATDSIELFPLATFDRAESCYRTLFLAHGLRYVPNHSRDRIERLARDERLFVLLDFQNTVDPRALALRTDDQFLVGYIPRYLVPDTWQLLEQCDLVEVFVDRVNPPPAPVQQRLLCEMVACCPDGFVPFSEQTYKPISADALVLTTEAPP